MTYPTAGQYKIVDELGRGGMGVVYMAHDPALDRFVALKFLPASMTFDPRAKERFLREARAAAGIEHPNICTIHEIGETEDDNTYIVMAYYDGASLDALLGRGPLSPERALEIAVQAADGLSAAHGRGIVHRDIKPGNILITNDGQVKLVDFGLAKLTGSIELTRTGAVIGTPAYMAPEQVRGDAVDNRADVWSLGVVLYEMLTGTSPFKRENLQKTMNAVLEHEITSVDSPSPDVRERFGPIIVAALAKEARERIATMAELATRLRAVAGSEARVGSRSVDLTLTSMLQAQPQAVHENSIVVLPFRDLSPDGDNEYFSDGLTEEVITDLSRIPALRVISRSSAMRLKQTELSLPAIGRELNVRFVLEGSVRRAADAVRIMAQLIDAENDSQIWAGKFGGTMNDIFEIQDQVSSAIVDALQLKLSSGDVIGPGGQPFDNVQAYESYLRARQEIWRWSEDALDRALRHLQIAVDLVGDHELLYAGIAYVHWQYVNIGVAADDHLDQAELYTRKVFEIAPNSPRGHRLLGLIQIPRGVLAEAVRHLRRSLESYPNDPDTLTWLAIAYGWLGKTESARPLVERLIAIDPLNAVNHGLPGWIDFCEGRFHAAVTSYRVMYSLEPENPAHRWFLIKALGYAGARDEAVALCEELERSLPENLFSWMCSMFTAALRGDQARVLKLAASHFAKIARNDLGHAWFVGICHAAAHRPEEAIDWLGTAIDRGLANYPLLAEHDPFLEPMREMTRFQALLARVKLAWEFSVD